MHSSGMAYLRGLAYYIWRAVRGRPQFIHLEDSRTTLAVTLALSFLSSLSLDGLMNEGGPIESPASWLFTSTVLVVGLYRPTRSTSLLASSFAAQVGFDVADAVLEMISQILGASQFNLATAGGHFMIDLCRCLAIWSMRSYFLKLPAYVQANGYNPHDIS